MNAQKQAATEYMAQLENILRELDELGVAVRVDVKKIYTNKRPKSIHAYLDPLSCYVDRSDNNIVFEYHVS